MRGRLAPLVAVLAAVTLFASGLASEATDRSIASATLSDASAWQGYDTSGKKAYAEGRYEEAEKSFRLALQEAERLRSSNRIAASLNNLAEACSVRKKYTEAESLYRRSLAMLEKGRGSESPDVAKALNNLAALYQREGKNAEAEPLYRRSLTIKEKLLGKEDLNLAPILNNLAEVCSARGNYAEAEELYKRSLTILEKARPESLAVAACIQNMALMYTREGTYGKAEPLYLRAIELLEKLLGEDHPNVATVLENFSEMLHKDNRPAAAAGFEQRIRAIRAAEAAGKAKEPRN